MSAAVARVRVGGAARKCPHATGIDGERGSWEEMEPICSTLAVEEKSERDLEVIWLNEEGRWS